MIDRRDFLQRSGALCVAGLFGATGHPSPAAAADPPRFRVRRLTSPPGHHFFGYYGMPPWNASGTSMVGLEAPFHHRLPEPGEAAGVVLIDPKSGTSRRVGHTLAWNLQQGALLHWNPLSPETEVIFNDLDQGTLKAAVLDVRTGRKRYLPRPISGVGTVGRHALSLTYGRNGRLRRVVGYAGVPDPYPTDPHPDDDGIFLMDLETGRSELIVSIGDIFRRSVEAYPVLAEREMWLDHTVFNDTGSRFLFLARTWGPQQRLDSAMFTANRDGSGLRQVIPYGSAVSHFDWRNDREIVSTYQPPNAPEIEHILFTDGEQDHRVIGDGLLVGDGHCTFAPDGGWMATDRKTSSTLSQSLWLFHPGTSEVLGLAMLPMKEKIFISGDTRCDFHPRWNRTGDAICFDAIDPATWTRQMHLVELEW